MVVFIAITSGPMSGHYGRTDILDNRNGKYIVWVHGQPYMIARDQFVVRQR